ncbi:MAG: hypothetical protein Tsb009_22210 [Planctomycetaceae bacterium]
MAYIETVPNEQATGLLRKIFDAAISRAGRVFNILRIMSIKPKTLQASMSFYTAIMHGPSPLSRAEREMIATVISRDNNCYY